MSLLRPPDSPGSGGEKADKESEAEGHRYGPKECGSCRLWRPILEDERGPIGPCRLQVRTGHFPGTAPTCERYLSRDAAIPSAPPPEPERRRSRRVGGTSGPVIRRADESANESPEPRGAPTSPSCRSPPMNPFPRS